MDANEEKDLFLKMNEGDIGAFSFLFKQYYSYLCNYATTILKNENIAEDVVQRFFTRLWVKRSKLIIESSVKNYFFQSVKNLCINEIKREKVAKNISAKIQLSVGDDGFERFFPDPDLISAIQEGIRSLPEKRREIFILSREKGLKYHEIAGQLNISQKTVETQMGLAIKTLREKLKDFID